MAANGVPVFTIAKAMNIAARHQIPEICNKPDCRTAATLPCTYLDSRGAVCGTWWCLRHLRRFGEGQYCRRHASTVAALGSRGGDPTALPPVDYRGASLVDWICTEGYEYLSAAILSGLRDGEVIFEDQRLNVLQRTDGERMWLRGWRLEDAAGVNCQIAIRVRERDDATVQAIVDERIVATGVPPWITHRRRGQSVPAAVESEHRRQFYGFLVQTITAALDGRS
jgi:hypothetical protein